jgi:hypothetical protein
MPRGEFCPSGSGYTRLRFGIINGPTQSANDGLRRRRGRWRCWRVSHETCERNDIETGASRRRQHLKR